MVGLEPCLRSAVSSPFWDILTVLSIYFITVSTTIGFYILISGLKLRGLNYELAEFIEHYKTSSLWWATSFITSIIALTIGGQIDVIYDVAILWIFFLPALYHFNSNYPFSLDCTYRATKEDNRTEHGQDEKNVAQMNQHGNCDIELNVQTGSNVDEFCLDLNTPPGVITRNLGTKIPSLELTTEDKIVGNAAPGKDRFSFDLYLEKDSHLISGRDNLVIRDDDTGRQLETVQIQPYDGS